MNDNILGIQDKKSAQAVRNIFNGLGLPVPGDGEYRKRSEGMGPLILVSRYGFVARIVPKDLVMTIDTPYFIKPLFNRAAGNHRFIIDPGYDLRGLGKKHACMFQRTMFEQYRVSCKDAHAANLAKVPGTDHLVLIDISPQSIVDLRLSLDDVSFLTRVARAVAKQLGIRSAPQSSVKKEPDSDPNDPQVALYKPLRDILEQAWPEGARTPDPEGIRAFKELCLAFKAKGQLRSDWDDWQNDYKGTLYLSQVYGTHLRAYEEGEYAHPCI